MSESPPDDEWQQLIEGVRAGDERACQQFWDQYSPLIDRVAGRHLSPAVRRRVGPETVVLSACRTFFRRAQQGEFQLTDAGSLWRLLCAITVNKVREKTRFHLRQKRGLQAEGPPGDELELPAHEPTPAEIVEFDEQLQQLFSRFDEDERRTLDLKLQQYTHDEIAQRLGCSERTVRRMVKRIGEHLRRMLDDE